MLLIFVLTASYIAANVIKFGSRDGNEDDHDDDGNKDNRYNDDAFPGREIFRQDDRNDQIIKAGEHVRLTKRMRRELFNSSYINIARAHTLTNMAHMSCVPTCKSETTVRRWRTPTSEPSSLGISTTCPLSP